MCIVNCLCSSLKFPPDSFAHFFRGVYEALHLPSANFFFYLLASFGIWGPGNLHYAMSNLIFLIEITTQLIRDRSNKIVIEERSVEKSRRSKASPFSKATGAINFSGGNAMAGEELLLWQPRSSRTSVDGSLHRRHS